MGKPSRFHRFGYAPDPVAADSRIERSASDQRTHIRASGRCTRIVVLFARRQQSASSMGCAAWLPAGVFSRAHACQRGRPCRCVPFRAHGCERTEGHIRCRVAAGGHTAHLSTRNVGLFPARTLRPIFGNERPLVAYAHPSSALAASPRHIAAPRFHAALAISQWSTSSKLPTSTSRTCPTRVRARW